ncbi:tetratricopeptide repeat protein [Streptomyces sp. MB09-01]|uniref:tetratricopeptide repeat protein n=1 Tax=Streptomyces sp. MB09-01 TaxID=3028666 RepID=UPI0029A99649|nr:tetratricopeptide repeat protein [Streptomyces sp. MB09-01]MDX3536505.1 tetratricopeptide repeat protein [Streptomyces sp. MB09-01]
MTWPHQVGVLPREADCFQDRATARELSHGADGNATSALCQVLVGLGGVGKTQLAAHHARTLWQTAQLDLLVWVTAATRDAVVTGYAQAAAEILGADPAGQESAARSFLAWLEPKPAIERRWLVVLDDLADPADLRNLWPPASNHGRTLVTTRRRDAALTGHGRRLVRMGLFTEDEAAAYLTTSLAAHDRHEPADQLLGLADDLGHLPLALSQAVAYLSDVDLDCATYRRRLCDRARSLSDALPDPSGLPDDQATTVAAAWSLSIESADRLPPAGLARPMLQLASMLDPNGIPIAVLTSPPALDHLARHRGAGPEHTGAGKVTVPDAAQALRALHRLSLIDHTPDSPQHTVRVHQLLQRAIRDRLPAGQHDRLARTAADALIAAWPEVERDTTLAQALRASTEALTLHAEDALYQPDTHPALIRTGLSLGEAGQVAAALHHMQHVANATQHRLSPDHPDTLTARSHVGSWQGATGDAAGAATAFEELFTDLERVLGPDHPDTLVCRGKLAYWRGEAGDAAGAARAFEELLTDRVRVLGPDHPDTLITRGNLAFLRGEAGDAAGAAAAFEELLTDRGRVLGPDHPDTLCTRGNHASWRGKAGDAAGAATAFEELLTDLERVLGPDHADTLCARGNHASWRGEAGDAAGAATAFGELFTDLERVLGSDHPATLSTRGNLAYWRGQAGDAAGAATAFEELLTDLERVLGPDHPDTLGTRNDPAYWRGRRQWRLITNRIRSVMCGE